MRVGFDISNLHSNHLTGVGVYIVELINALVKQNISLSGIYKISRYKNRSTITSNSGLDNIKPFIPHVSSLLGSSYEIFHGPDFWIPNSQKFKKVITIHDLNLFNEKFFPIDRIKSAQKSFYDSVIRHKPDAIIAVSHFVKQELIQLFPEIEYKTHVVYHGADHFQIDNVDEAPKLDFPYILYLGTIEYRKNIKALVDSFLVAKSNLKDIKLVLAGNPNGHLGAEIVQYIHSKNIANDIIILGYVSTESAKNLLKNALFMVYPSLYEGFGFPILESMKMQTPVLTSSFGAMAEIAGESALKVDTRDINIFSNALIEFANNNNLRDTFIQSGIKRANEFTWEKCGLDTKKIYHSIL
jgi:glycosyltransferase involved in cell wall biosynthesis